MMITVVDHHLRLLVALEGIIEFEHFLINKTDAYPRLYLMAGDIENLGKTFQRRIVVAHQLIGNADAVPGLDIGLVAGQNLFKERNGPFILFEFL